ncbi:hypothetical protein ACE2AJ_19050 [Aquihabitans daechungensis]|uniref:hypothetical protein n=1 Tax=Aquihabitans daechungensis TaxID=1052257 RepID=UPI003BA29F9E
MALPPLAVLAGVVLIGVALGWCVRRRWVGEAGYLSTVLLAVVLCGFQTSRLPASTFNVAPFAFTTWHVRYWVLSLGCALWIGVGWVGVRAAIELASSLAERRADSSQPMPRLRPAAWAGITVALVLLVAVVLPPRPAVWRDGEAQQSALVQDLADEIAPDLDHGETYLAEVSVYDAATLGGAMNELWSRGYDIVVPEDTAFYWGPGSGCRDERVDGVLSFRRGTRTEAPVPDGSRVVASVEGAPEASARMASLTDDLDRALAERGGVAYDAAAAERFVAAFPGADTAAKRAELLPTFASGLESDYDLITLLELQDAGVLDEPGLTPLLDDLEAAGARFLGAFGPVSRVQGLLGDPERLPEACR